MRKLIDNNKIIFVLLFVVLLGVALVGNFQRISFYKKNIVDATKCDGCVVVELTNGIYSVALDSIDNLEVKEALKQYGYEGNVQMMENSFGSYTSSFAIIHKNAVYVEELHLPFIGNTIKLIANEKGIDTKVYPNINSESLMKHLLFIIVLMSALILGNMIFFNKSFDKDLRRDCFINICILVICMIVDLLFGNIYTPIVYGILLLFKLITDICIWKNKKSESIIEFLLIFITVFYQIFDLI